MHVALILDGNRRWAKKRACGNGHQQGYLALKNLLKSLLEQDSQSSPPKALDSPNQSTPSPLRALTVFALSTENLSKRGKEELSQIFDILSLALSNDGDLFIKNGVKFRCLGERERLPYRVVDLINKLEEDTKEGKDLLFCIALDYGGHWDLAKGCQAVAVNQELTSSWEAMLAKALPSGFLPPVDLLIRTGGEQRISNFLPWQLAYAELYFIDKLWPDFNYEDFKHAIEWYQTRNRRFGGETARTVKEPSLIQSKSQSGLAQA